MPPKVSVIMPMYNRELYLPESITSILNQTFQDFEFIIVDDGSTDRSQEIVEEYMAQDSRVQLIRLAKNAGTAHATNQGIKQASGQYIAFMDSDDISMPLRLQQQVDFFEQNPHIDVLGSQMQVVNKLGKPLFVYSVPQQHSHIVWNLFFGWTFGNPSVMMRSDMMRQVGGYDETFITSKDVDLWARLVGQARFANLPDKLVTYRTHDNSISSRKKEEQHTALYTVLMQLLKRLWDDEVPEDLLARFIKIRSGKPQFRKDEYEQVKTDLPHLATSMLAQGWILSDEKHLIDADIQRIFELAKPKSKGLLSRLRGKLRR